MPKVWIARRGVRACVCIALLLGYCSLVESGGRQKPGDTKSGGPLAKNLEDAYPNFIIRPFNNDAAIAELFSLTKKANAGDAISQHDLGLCYLEGFGTVPDTVKAAYWIGRAARQGHAVANFNRAVFAMNGWGVPWNPFEAYDGLKFAADAGMKEAQYYMSRLLIENLVVARNIPMAYGYIKLSADSGYAPAKEVLAEFMKNGWDKEKPPAEKSHSRQSKGEKAKPAASSVEPVFLSFSHDTASHPSYATLAREAKEQLKSVSKRDTPDTVDAVGSGADEISPAERERVLGACERANPEALMLVGQWFETANGVKRDGVLAAAAYLHALRLDSPRAPKIIYDLARSGTLVKSLKPRVDAKDPAAMYVWAELAAMGMDNSITDQQAYGMLGEAARMGYAPAVIELGSYLMAGYMGKKDPDKALALWAQAAQAGNGEAADRLLIAKVLTGIEPMSPRRWEEILATADSGSVLAQYLAGVCAEQGLGVGQSKKLAAKWYREAAARGSNAGFEGLIRVYDSLRPASEEYSIRR